MKQQANYFLNPTAVSELKPVYDNTGKITAWGVTVTFNNQNIEPPHAKGSRVTTQYIDGKTLAEYNFVECVMKKGLRQALLFRDAMVKQIARQNSGR